MNGHRHMAKTKKNYPLYNAINKHGIENFSIVLIEEFENHIDVCAAEIKHIAEDKNTYNLAIGGQIGGVVVCPETRARMNQALKLARKGKTPALGMKHTEENKRKFSECGKLRWDIYGRYPDEVITMSYKDAKEKFGISKTHYYRLLKQRGSSNETT